MPVWLYNQGVAQNDQIGLMFISYLISFIVESICDLNKSTLYLQCFHSIHLEFALCLFIYLQRKKSQIKIMLYYIRLYLHYLAFSLFWGDVGAVSIQTNF